MDEVLDRLNEAAAGTIPDIIAAIVVLAVGLIVALVVAAVVRRILRSTSVDDRIARKVFGEERAKGANVEEATGKAVFWLIMVFVFVATFQVLGLTLITEPLNRLLNDIFAFLPNLLGAAILILVAWVLASLVRMLVSQGLRTLNVDERVGDQTAEEPEEIEETGEGERAVPVSQALGEAAYWLVFLLFLPAILGVLALEGLLQPVQAMIDEFLAFLPNLLSAAIIALVGWFVARIVQRIVTNLLASAGVDRLSERVGLSDALGSQRLSKLIGLIVYILILIPVLIAALNALRLEAVSQPASNMLNTFLEAIPAIFGAAVLLALAYVVGRLVASLVSSLLAGIGFNRIFVRLNLTDEAIQDTRWTPSAIVGYIVLIAILLFATTEAFALLGFEALAVIVAEFLVFAGHVLLGLIIFGLGAYLADLAARAVRGSGVTQAGLLAVAARVSILVLAAAMALREMGFANNIILLGFGLVVGAIAVALAIAFGVGGRHIAGRELEGWVKSLKSEHPER